MTELILLDLALLVAVAVLPKHAGSSYLAIRRLAKEGLHKATAGESLSAAGAARAFLLRVGQRISPGRLAGAGRPVLAPAALVAAGLAVAYASWTGPAAGTSDPASRADLRLESGQAWSPIRGKAEAPPPTGIVSRKARGAAARDVGCGGASARLKTARSRDLAEEIRSRRIESADRHGQRATVEVIQEFLEMRLEAGEAIREARAVLRGRTL